MALKLYGNQVCPFVQRVMIVCAEKNIEYEYITVLLGKQMPQWYKELNRRGTVPSLQVGDKMVFESLLICQFLDETYGEPNLLFPSDPFVRAEIRDYINNVWSPTFKAGCRVLYHSGEERKQLIDDLDTGLRKINAVLAERQKTSPGPFFLGTEFSLADIAVVPFIERMNTTHPFFLKKTDLFTLAPLLKVLYEAAMKRPAVRKCANSVPFILDSHLNGPLLQSEQAHKLKMFVRGDCRCVKAHRLAWVAEVKGIPWDFDVTPSLKGAPVMSYLGREMEAAVGFEFLCEAFSHRPPELVPQSTLARAAARFLLDDSNWLAGEAQSAIQFFLDQAEKAKDGGEPTDDEKAQLEEAAQNQLDNVRRAARSLEDQFAHKTNKTGPYIAGEQLSLGDLAALPILMEVDVKLSRLSGCPSILREYPRLSQMVDAAGAQYAEIFSKIRPIYASDTMPDCQAADCGCCPDSCAEGEPQRSMQSA